MTTNIDDSPLVTDDLSTAEREARLRSFRTKQPYFWAERQGHDDETAYLVAPWANFGRFADVGWLLWDTCGEPRDAESDHGLCICSDYNEAMLEANLRVHGARRVSTAIAIRGDGDGNAFAVLPLTEVERLEEAGWQVCEEFLPS